MESMGTGHGGEELAVHHGPSRTAVMVLEGLIGASAVYGGIGLAVNGLGMPDEWLERTPFGSWVVPGLALLAVVALPQLVALALEWRRHPLAPRVSLVAGVVLMGWIAAQILVLRRYFFLQPLLFALGAAEAAFALPRAAEPPRR